MTQENLKLKNVQNEKQTATLKAVCNKACKNALKTAEKSKKCIQNKKQMPLEVWDNLDVIPSRAVYPDNLPADNVDAALYLINLNK